MNTRSKSTLRSFKGSRCAVDFLHVFRSPPSLLWLVRRRSVEPVVMRRPEDAHHPGRPGRADQRRDHPALGLGHVPPHPGGPQASPALLPGPPQRHRLPPVSS